MIQVRIKFLVMDVDGTLTNNNLNYAFNGELFKTFNVKDGYAIKHILHEYNVIPIILTGRKSQIIDIRFRELGVCEIYQGISNKEAALVSIMNKWNNKQSELITYDNIAYIGDDLPDLECIKAVKLSGCPADAVDEIKKESYYICNCKGGDGAVREFIEWLIKNGFIIK